jgi:hypothetical protein
MPPPKTPRPIPVHEFQEASDPPHDWGHRGIAPFMGRGNGTFWASWARQIIAFVFGALTAAFVVGGKSRDLSDLLVWRGAIDAEIQRMNNEGTRASKARVNEEAAQIQNNTNSINELLKKVEPIGAMQAKIERLQHDIDARK